MSPIVGIRQIDKGHLSLLYDAIPHTGTQLFISPQQIDIPSSWAVLHLIPRFQMVYAGDEIQITGEDDLITLTDEHIPQMLALTKLTNPGPFAQRTIDFGYYKGVFEGDTLVAMAGQRMYVPPYAEISAVCTHPDHLGKGYARKLLIHHVSRLVANGEIPFLHVRHDNDRAIAVYKSLGFRVRIPINFYILRKGNV